MSSEECSPTPVEPPSASATRDPGGLTAYRSLPAAAGWGFLVATGLGRLPLSMVPLAILTLASAATGSIAVGGVAAAASALGEAVGAPVAGALTDRHGQRRVLLIGVVLHLAALLAFGASAGLAPDPVVVMLAGAAGLTLPQVGALSRARWLVVAPQHRQTAFAFEGAIDEVVYIFGPALVGLIAVVSGPAAALIVSGLLVAVFVSWFAVHPSHRLVPRRRKRSATAGDARPPRMRGRDRLLVAVAFTGMLAMGVFFGASQTGLTAFAEEARISGAGPLLYAVMAVGSAATTLAMVAVPGRIRPWARWMIAGAGMTAGSLLLVLADDTAMVIVACVLAGAFQGPLMLTVFDVSGSVARPGSGGIVMTLTASGVVLGLAVGAAVSGVLAEHLGSAGAFVVVLAVSALQVVLGFGMRLVAQAPSPVTGS